MKINQKFVFEFENNSGADIVIEVDGHKGIAEAYNEARDSIINESGMSIRKFEKNWNLVNKQLALGVKDSSLYKTEVKSLINDIEEVESVEIVESGSYEWKFYVSTSPVVREDYVLDIIEELIQEAHKGEVENDFLVALNPLFFSGETNS